MAGLLFAYLVSIELGTSRARSREAAATGNEGEEVIETSTSRLFDVAALASLVAGFAASLFVRPAAIRARRTTFLVGLALFAASALLSASARRHLGRFHRDNLTIHDNQVLVDTGPYKHVRHPLYLATAMTFVAIGATLGNWLSLAAAVLPVAALVRRIRVEESMLVEHLGDDYQAYQDRTRHLLPGAW